MKAVTLSVVLPGILALTLAGCATKKHVAQAIAPVQNQVNEVQKQTNDNKTAIGDLDRQVSTADEKAMDAGRKAGDAASAAAKANDAAMSAGQRADSAHTLAEQTGVKVNELDQTVQNLDNYSLSNTQKVFFRFGRADLTREAKAELDAMAQNVSTMKNYVLEVEGYTDRTGGKNYNLGLSQRRADAVVRYLTMHNVPLRKIHMIGIGSETAEAAHTREARKQERRVDVRVYALATTGGKPLQSSTSPAQQ